MGEPDTSDGPLQPCASADRGEPMNHDSEQDRVVMLHGPLVRSLTRFKRFMVAAILVLGLANAAVWQLATEGRRELCEQRNTQIVRSNEAAEHSRAFLRDVTKAMHADGDHEAAMALERYIEQIEQAPHLAPVKC